MKKVILYAIVLALFSVTIYSCTKEKITKSIENAENGQVSIGNPNRPNVMYAERGFTYEYNGKLDDTIYIDTTGKEMHYIVEEADGEFIAHIFDDETSMQNWASKSRFNDVMNEWYSNRTLALNYASSIGEFDYVESKGEYSEEYTEFLNTLQWTAKVRPKGTGVGVLFDGINGGGILATVTQNPRSNLYGANNRTSSISGLLIGYGFCDYNWWNGSKIWVFIQTPNIYVNCQSVNFDNRINSFF